MSRTCLGSKCHVCIDYQAKSCFFPYKAVSTATLPGSSHWHIQSVIILGRPIPVPARKSKPQPPKGAPKDKGQATPVSTPSLRPPGPGAHLQLPITPTHPNPWAIATFLPIPIGSLSTSNSSAIQTLKRLLFSPSWHSFSPL